MIYIQKASEPKELVEHRSKKYSTYDNCPTDVKDQIKEYLLKEQGFVCAYCMKKIISKEAIIEHFVCQSFDKTLDLDYKNMLGVCDGGKNSKGSEQTCDAKKGNLSLEKINPTDKEKIKLIKYKNDGTIYSEDPIADNELNEILNLNAESFYLTVNRKSTYTISLKRMKSKGDWNKNEIQKELDFLKGSSTGEVAAASGMAILLLENKLSKLTNK